MAETVRLTHLTITEVFDAHAQFGRLDRELVKKAMGPNWPRIWDGIGAGEGIFEPTQLSPKGTE